MRGSLVLLPTYNESENLPRVLPRLFRLDDEVDVLIIDDASPDGTGEIAEDLRTSFPRVSVLHRRVKEGLGRAYVHGFREALCRGYRQIVTMDADLSHAPEDVAIGSRHISGGGVEGWSVARSLLSRGGSFYARTLFHLPVSDVTSGFRAYRAETLRLLELDHIGARGFVFQVELLRRILDLPGTRALEVPIAFRNRRHGASKLSFEIITEAATEVAKLAFRGKTLREASRQSRPSRKGREPGVSVVIPARPGPARPDGLKHLASLAYPADKIEVLVAWGHSPSRQRNEAVKAASGEYILFLDEDSRVSPDLLRIYLSVFERDRTVGVVGGPVTPEPGSRFQELAALVLGEPWVVGRTASRYQARGEARFTDERELILCNLCVHREAFEALGGFEEALYPNEENEFLERLRLSGWKLVHHPQAVVRRPQKRIGELIRSVFRVFRYGKRRSAQLRILPSNVQVLRVLLALGALLAAALGLGGLVTSSFLLALPLISYGAYLLLVYETLRGLRPETRLRRSGNHLLPPWKLCPWNSSRPCGGEAPCRPSNQKVCNSCMAEARLAPYVVKPWHDLWFTCPTQSLDRAAG